MTPWTTGTLEEICRFQAGSAFPKKYQGKSIGDFPFIKVSDLSQVGNEIHITTASNWVSESEAKEMKAKIIPASATVFAKIGEGLKAERFRLTNRATLIDNNMMAAIPSGHSPRFVRYAMEIAEISKLVEGSALPYLRQTDLQKISIQVPPPEEERSIAATLGALDDKIESNNQAMSLTRSLLDALAEVLGRGLPTVPLNTLATLVKDGLNPQGLDDTIVDLYSLPAFDSGERPEHIAPASIKSNKNVIPAAAILVSRLNPRIDRTWWVNPMAGVRALASTEFACLTGPDNELAAVWLAVRDPYFLEQIKHRVTGTSGSHQRIRPADLMAIEVPDFRLLSPGQKSSVHGLLSIYSQRNRENEKLESLRDTLLPELMSGRIRVPEAREAVDELVEPQEEVGDALT